MDKTNEYITIDEASKITKKSVSTIRRFVLSHKNSGDDIIKVDINDRNRPLYRINKQFILTYFDIIKKSIKKNLSDTNSYEPVDRKIISNYFFYKNSYKLIRNIFIIFIIFSVIFDICMLFGFIYYKKGLDNAHIVDIDYLTNQISTLNTEMKNNRKAYRNILLEYKEMWRENTQKDNVRDCKIIN
jgi:hypothetical protein